MLVTLEGGKIVGIKGDPQHPMNRGFICPKGAAYPEFVFHPHRLTYPLRRTGERGAGKWERVSWDTALSAIAAKFAEVKKRHGAEAICIVHGTGPKSNLFSCALLARALGTPNHASVGYLCYIPSVVAGVATHGGDILQEVGPDYLNSRCILVWAANPLISHPPRGRDILEAKKKGAKLLVVDPRYTELASKADLWAQIRPGTDDALALGMLHVIINEGLFDEQFVSDWCVGFEQLKERVQEYPPSRVSEITWIPQDKIIELARAYATNRPASLHHRVSLEMHINAAQTLRALNILVAVTGNIDQKGGNVFPVYPTGFTPKAEYSLIKDLFPLPLEVQQRRMGADEFRLLSGPDAPIPRAHLPSVIRAILTEEPYPIKAMFTTSNIVLNLQGSKEVWAALKKLDFLVVADFFMTPTAELADIVLPAATWMERDEICDYSYTNFISVRQKVIEPVGECWDDLKIAIELMKRMGLARHLPFQSVEQWNDYKLRGMGMTFADLREKAYIIEPMRYEKYKEAGFNTPSGKVELYSSLFERNGYDPLPYYEENPETPVTSPELMAEYPFILITGPRHLAFFHSEGRQIPSLRKLCPEPVMEVHPDTARELGIRDGDWVWIEIPGGRGRVQQRARVTDMVHPKMVTAQHNWWFPEEPGPEHGCWRSNINVIMPNEPPYDPVVGASPVRGCLCRIYK
ncbi:MAG: molybdopterin oxidoreductase [Chloroflexi bacterium]|nr:MAG: molybdopterin oxidoreductase [Chloroflexota bacterium]